MKALVTRFIRETEGQDLIEYALLAAGIALAAIAAINSVGTAINSKFTTISTQVAGS